MVFLGDDVTMSPYAALSLVWRWIHVHPSVFGGFYDPLYLTVTCSFLVLPVEYSYAEFSETETRPQNSIFSSCWFDSGYVYTSVCGVVAWRVFHVKVNSDIQAFEEFHVFS